MKPIWIAMLALSGLVGTAQALDKAQPSAADVQAHAQAINSALQQAVQVKQAVEDFRRRNGRFPSSNEIAGTKPPAGYANPDVKRIAIGENGVLEITLTATSGVDDGVIRWIPRVENTDENRVEWRCVSPSYATISDDTTGICEYTKVP